MNLDLQHRFEKQMLEAGITEDRRVFNKDSKGRYIRDEVWWMYRVWINQEARVEKLLMQHKKEVEESFMCGYTDAEYDFMKKRGEL